MTRRFEPVLHALSVEPRSARPGETVCVEFRARNLGTLPSPPATVAFALSDGLEALGACEVDVAPVAPGDHAVATILARVGMPLEDRSELAVQAVLRLPGAELGTNVCALLVRSRALLGGPASGTFVEALDGELVRVRAVVVNEGDGPARELRLVVPPPAGCVRTEGEGPATLHRERLDVGHSAALEFLARIVAPVDELSAGDAVVWIGERPSCALPARGIVVPEPLIVPPRVQLRTSRGRVEVRVEVRNDGWAEASSAAVRITLPHAMTLVDGSVAVDGVPAVTRAARRRGNAAPFARLARSADTYTIALPPIPARDAVTVAMAAAFPAGWDGGTIYVAADSHETAVAFDTVPARDVRVHVADAPRSASPGDVIRFHARVVNGGDVPETLRCTAAVRDAAPAGWSAPTQPANRNVAPGYAAVVPLAVQLADDAAGTVVLDVVVSDADGERVSAQHGIAVRRPVSIAPEESPSLAPAEAPAAAAHARLTAPSEVVAGAPFALQIDVEVAVDADALIVRVSEVAGATYVAGSTAIDGCALLDRAGRSPLDEGLLLRAVRAGTHAVVRWSCLADGVASDAPLTIAAAVEGDGASCAACTAETRVVPSDPFAMRPTGLPYHVEACTAASVAVPRAVDVEPPAVVAMTAEPLDAAAESQPRDHLPSFTLRLDADRIARIRRRAGDPGGGGLVAHVLALGALFPDAVTHADAGMVDAFHDVRTTLEDVFDRLYVKLRIPGFYVAADDLEDPALRRALATLFERIGQADACALLAQAPYGAPPVLRALGALVSRTTTGCQVPDTLESSEFAVARERYVQHLDAVLAHYDGMPLEIFDDALARGSDRGLDEACSALQRALSSAAGAEIAC